MDENIKCDHVWIKCGLWDGKTPDGKPTGGIMYKCNKCGDEAQSMEEIKSKGGSLDQSTDIYGRPKKDKESDFIKTTIIN